MDLDERHRYEGTEALGVVGEEGCWPDCLHDGVVEVEAVEVVISKELQEFLLKLAQLELILEIECRL